MIIVLLENNSTPDLSELRKLNEKYPKTCRAKINNKTPMTKVKSYSKPPILANRWLLMCDKNTSNSMIKQLNQQTNNLCVFRVINQRESNKLMGELNELGIEFQFIDNINISEERMRDFVRRTLKTDEDTISYLVKACRGYLPTLVANVYLLKPLGEITKQMVIKYCTFGKKGALFDLLNTLIGIEPDYQLAISVIHQYRYAGKYLTKYLRDSIKEMVDIFEVIGSGDLTMENYIEFKKNTSISIISNMHNYRLKKIVESFQFISYDYLLFLQSEVNKLTGTTDSLVKLINLCKLTL